MIFNLSQAEKESGTIADDTLSSIVHQIETIGFAVIEDLVSRETCDLLSTSVLEDVDKVKATGKPTAHERHTGRGHLQLGLRRHAPYVTADLVANPLIECVVAAVLGRGAWLGFYNGNVNCPDSTHQPLHFDRPFSWTSPEAAAQDGQRWPPPTTTLSCSVALKEISEANGATEIYPGTHQETEVIQWEAGDRIENHPDLMARWAPAGRMPIPAGGICFRDPRMWHRGVPNPTETPRAMIALTYHAEKCRHWRGRMIRKLSAGDVAKCIEDPTLRVMDDRELGDGRLVFQEDTRQVFESSPSLHGINRNIRFVESPLKVNHFLDAQNLGGARVVSEDDLSPQES